MDSGESGGAGRGRVDNTVEIGECVVCGWPVYRYQAHECQRDAAAIERADILGFLRGCVRRHGDHSILADDVHRWLGRVARLGHRALMSEQP